MMNVKALAAKAVVSLVVVGTLAGGTVVAAGAATTTNQPSVTQSHAAARKAVVHQQSCQRERRLEAFASKNQARFAARTARFQALAARATTAGNPKLAKYWDSVVARRTKTTDRRHAAQAARATKNAHRQGKARLSC